jgi:hypothetical protein
VSRLRRNGWAPTGIRPTAPTTRIRPWSTTPRLIPWAPSRRRLWSSVSTATTSATVSASLSASTTSRAAACWRCRSSSAISRIAEWASSVVASRTTPSTQLPGRPGSGTDCPWMWVQRVAPSRSRIRT